MNLREVTNAKHTISGKKQKLKQIMLQINRHQRILDLLNEQGIVHIGHLSQEFDVSEMTIHRDLAQLETDGYLRKVRGGAVPVSHPPQMTNQSPPAASEPCFMCQTIPRKIGRAHV